MSGIYIPGMDMPTSCFACPLVREDVCAATEYTISRHHWRDRADTCPLIPVPEHGRLVDADALMKIIKAHDYPLRAHFNSTDNGMFTIGIQQAVDETPTIIPASKEGEG